MKRIQYHQYGGPEVMRLEDVEPARPGKGEVLVRVRAAGVNPMDAGIRAGKLKMMTGQKFPRGLGHDFSGVVEAVGDGVTRFRAGDEVLGGASIKAAGAFAEFVVAEEKALAKKPASVSWEQAAALPTPAVTAYQSLVSKGKLKAGQAVFVAGAQGAVGRSAVQLATMMGARVGGSSRNAIAHEELDPIVDFDFDPATLARRFDIVLDASGKLPLKSAKTMVKPGGHIIDIHPAPAKFARAALPGPYEVLVASAVTADLEQVVLAAGKGALVMSIAGTVPLAEAIPALTAFEGRSGAKGGKLIIAP